MFDCFSDNTLPVLNLSLSLSLAVPRPRTDAHLHTHAHSHNQFQYVIFVSFIACLDNMVQRWKEGVALRWLNPASVQHVIALFVAVAICRSVSRVSFCMRRAHTSRQVLLLVMRMNKNRNSQQRESLSQEYTLSRFQALRTCTLHARIQHVHKTLATSWRLVRVTRPARACRTRCLALSSSWLGRPLSLSLSLMCSVSAFIDTVVRVGYTHAREPTHKVSRSSGLLLSVRFVDGQSHLVSGLHRSLKSPLQRL